MKTQKKHLKWFFDFFKQLKTAKLSPEKKRDRTLRDEQGKLNSMMKKYMKDNDTQASYFYQANRNTEDNGLIEMTGDTLSKIDVDSELIPEEVYSNDKGKTKKNEHVLENQEIHDINLDQFTHTLKKKRWQNIVNKTLNTLSVAEFKKILKEE